MNEINIGVLGGDGRGTVSLLAHDPAQGVRIIAVCGLDLERLDIYKEQCGNDVFLTKDYRELLSREDIHAVFICTPDHLHFEHASAALRAGKHVFLEKPMTISIEDCDSLMRLAEEMDRKLFVGHNMRCFPVMKKMHSLIAEGRIGRVEAIWCRHFICYGGDAFYKDWHSERANTNSLLLQKGAHDIDIIHWLGGGHSRRVVGMGKLSVYNEVTDRRKPDEAPNLGYAEACWPPLSQRGLSPVIDIEDHNMLLMQLDNGVQASYEQCQYSPDAWRSYTIIGTEGRIENYGDYSTEENWASVHLWNRRCIYLEQGHEVFRIPPEEGSHGGADPLVVADFIRYLRTGEFEGATLLDARMAVAAGCLGSDSLRDGSTPRDVPNFIRSA